MIVGELPPGPLNAITDVTGVLVGHTTLIEGKGPLRPGHGPVRTGVTVILPHGGNLFREKVRAAVHTINGFGKVTGFEEVRELGVIEAPIALTNTLNVGLVADALVQHSLGENPEIGISAHSVNVVVGETNDGYLNDIQGRHVRAGHVWAALASAKTGAVDEGNVGAGTGTTCFGWKGGIGTASRVVPDEGGRFTVGALVQSNFGQAQELRVLGYPVGKHVQPPDKVRPPVVSLGEKGSVMVVLATDAPLSERQLGRLCVRAGAGLARMGSVHDHGSGDFVIAFSTAVRLADPPLALVEQQPLLLDEGRGMHWLLPAVADCVEEAVLNSLCSAETMIGRDGNVRNALPVEKVVELVREAYDAD